MVGLAAAPHAGVTYVVMDINYHDAVVSCLSSKYGDQP
jgi:hypothetical protein